MQSVVDFFVSNLKSGKIKKQSDGNYVMPLKHNGSIFHGFLFQNENNQLPQEFVFLNDTGITHRGHLKLLSAKNREILFETYIEVGGKYMKLQISVECDQDRLLCEVYLRKCFIKRKLWELKFEK